MILVDTSIWIDHFDHSNGDLAQLLEGGGVVVHPMVVGELRMGNAVDRGEVFGLLAALPRSPVADHSEVAIFVEHHQLQGTGLQYIDAHLLAAAALMGNGRLWSADRRLVETAERLNLAVV